MDINSPAVKKHFEIPPALVEAVHDDPSAIQPSARVMAFQLAHEMFVESPNYTPSQKLALNEHLAKLGGLGQKQEVQHSSGQGYQLVINIGDTSQTVKSVTVDSTAVEVEDASI